ncbi:hypothetical protein B6I21_02710 [candidate division KSB1 bacterium 4572_119]|nr:MAG: hypothetical protein B6I21_02710 [candidate division KSB1 bacterium 4572_119]
MQFTIKELLEKYQIIVPQLQRDYAQGRGSEADLRKSFVSKIKQALQNESKPLNLDFIYGYTEATSNESIAFKPIDGQQRLTTLWLMLWFLSPRENNIIPFENQKFLSNFTYETRLSTKRFCLNLVSKPISLQTDRSISEQITDTPWFMASWSNDPTIISMLNMLDTLKEEMEEKEIAWENLANNKKITFDYIDIKSEEFKLTDELYIKMNSRGKPLTLFENFKAQFSSLLSLGITDYTDLKLEYEGTKVSYQQYFAFNIDSIWMDLFWKYRNKVKTNIDDCIYNFINFVAEFLFYKDNPKTLSSEIIIDFDFLNNVFASKKNIDFLLNSLDWLSKIEDINHFFETLFNGLSTFDDAPNDYFYRAITDTSFDVKDRVIIYTILRYCTALSIMAVDDELKCLVRIVRNLLFTVRQPNQRRKIEYVSNLRLPNVADYCKFIDAIIEKKNQGKTKSFYQIFADNEFTGFAKDYIHNEKAKAKVIVSKPNLKQSIHQLEEHSQIQGNTVNFKLDSADIENKIKAFLEIWSNEVESNLIIRALLTIDDYSVRTHPYSALGEIWYLGCSDFWNRILTAFSNTLDSFLILYLKTSGNTPTEKLTTIIENYPSDNWNWRYYFIKYKAITKNPYLSLNLFTWDDENGFITNSLGNSGTHPLHSYHLNPYLIALKILFDSNKQVTLSWGRFTKISYIIVAGKIYISVGKEGWVIEPKGNYKVNSDIVQKYVLEEKDDKHILKETNDKDKIGIAKDFISDILNI